MSKIHVLLKKEELDAQRLPDKVVVVLDVLVVVGGGLVVVVDG